MSVTIVHNHKGDIDNLIRRSHVSEVPDARIKLIAFMAASDEVWTGLWKGDIACMFGIISPSLLSDKAYIWMLWTDLVEKHKFVFVRHSQMWLEDLQDRYPIVYGHVECSRPRAKAWLQWLGAKFGSPDEGCIPFEIRKSHERSH